MKSIVIYNSQTGFTKRYAEWISEGAGCECVEFKNAVKMDLSQYEAIVFGGWCMAGNVVKLDWFKKQIPSLSASGKKLIVFAVGASPAASEDVPVAMERLLSTEEHAKVKVFYCQGGIDYDKMKAPSRFAMKFLAKTLKNKKDATQKEKDMSEMISKSYDISDKKYAEPIIAELV